jgi:oligopeptide transport system substrate-binding protein
MINLSFYKKFLMLVASGTLLFSCTKKEESVDGEKVLTMLVSAQVKGLDPIFANDRYSGNEVARVYEGLLEYHYLKRPYELVPNLAEAMPEISADGLTYTFKILKGVLFHDDAAFPNGKGRELKASDFVYSLKRLADPRLQSEGFWVLDGKLKGLNEWRDKYAKIDKVNYDEDVEGLMALDDYTLQFKLTKPSPQFLNILAMSFTYAVAREVVEKYGKEFLNHPVGTGAFVLPVFTQTNKIEYTKNPTYREKFYPSEASPEIEKMGYLADAGKRLPLVDKIVVNIIVESQPAWLNFLKGKLDYMGIPKDNFEMAIKDGKLSDELTSKGISLSIDNSLDVTYSAFNMEHPLFKSNTKLRQAMALAQDQAELNVLFYNDRALPAQSVIPPGIAGYNASSKNPFGGQDLERAKKLLAEAGYPEGKGLPVITYDCAAATTSRQITELFQKQMAKIGVKIQVVPNPWTELQRKIQTKQVMMFGMAWGADYPDAENFLQLFYGPNGTPGSNNTNYKNPEFDKMYEQAVVMQDSPERTALYEKLNTMVLNDAPWVLGVHRQLFTMRHGWIKNLLITDFEQGREKYLNIDNAKKIELSKKL